MTILRLLATVLSQSTFAASAEALATELAFVFRCDRVSVGLLEHASAQVVAMSNSRDFDGRHEEISAICAAMDEAIDQGVVLVQPPVHATMHITLAHSALLKGGGAVCTVPLAHGQSLIGALTLERAAGAFDDAEQSALEDLSSLVAPHLQAKRAAERTALQRSMESLRHLRDIVLAPGLSRTKAAVYGAGALAFVLTLVPLPYRISAPARLEGSMQRVVVAPVDGFLHQINVRPGDVVREKQVLAELAGEDLELERRKRESELLQHENAYQAALARSDRTLLVVNQAKAGEARAQLALVENQLDRAQIRAPFDGVVIKGDLTQSLGAPVRRGETLLTLAPAEQFRLIVEVDERDIAGVHTGQTGSLALAAMPQEKMKFLVERIMPVATAGDGRSFFEVEARIESLRVPLRPGLKGVAKLDADRHSLAWMLSHRLLDWLRLNLWALGF